VAHTAGNGAPSVNHSRALAFIVITVTINMIGVGLAWPVLPKLLQQMEGGSVAQAAFSYAFIAILFAAAQFIFAPLLGSLSDRYGRKPILLICLAGVGLDYLLTGLVATPFWLGVVRFVGGMFAATVTTVNAYAADISTPENRARNFGLIGASFGVGFILGPLLGGWLGAIDLRLPFFVAAGLAFANVVFGFLVLPESLPASNRRAFCLHESNPISGLRRVAAFPPLLPLLFALLVTAIAQRGLEAIWVLYTDFRFGWDIRAAAWSLAFVGVMYVIVQGALIGPAVRRFGEWRVMIGGFSVAFVSLALYALADQGWMVYPLIALYAIGNGLAGPSLNAVCSQTVDKDRQGQLQGALQSVNALAVVIGPFAASLILSHVASVDPVIAIPGAWFALGAALFATALLMSIIGFRRLSA